MLLQVSPVFAVYSDAQVEFVPEARDGEGMLALVLEVLFVVGQTGVLNGVPCGGLRQTLVPKRRFEQLLLIAGLKA